MPTSWEIKRYSGARGSGLGEPLCEMSMCEDGTREGLVIMENIFEISERACENINVMV